MKKPTPCKTDKTPGEAAFDLTQAPFLGPTRVRSLADAGISTLGDLHAATPDEIGRITGVGLRNALRIKEWLSQHASADPGTPPPPPSIDAASPAAGAHSGASCDPEQAETLQTIYDELENLDQQLSNLRTGIGAKKLKKRLAQQFDKLSLIASELVEGPDTLTTKTTHRSAKELERVVGVLEKASKRKSWPAKKQDALAAAVREHRKFLQRLIGD